MKQPVSRYSFERHRGYLGVYLQEGAAFVDACWNEATEIQSASLREAILDAGLDGTAGMELLVEDAHFDEKNNLAHVTLRGGPGRFYCGGLPVLWPEARRVATRILRHEPHYHHEYVPEAYGVYLRAWVEIEDALERPDLDDPGIGAERGSFRTRVRSQVFVSDDRQAPPGETNLLLTVQGSYISDINALYRIEPVALLGPKENPDGVSILWDSAGASVVAQVTDLAVPGATKIELSRTDGFEKGHYVRFEGEGIEPHIYKVTNCDTTSITVEAHCCGNERQSQTASPRGLIEPLDPFQSELAAALVLPSRSFDVCVEVTHRFDWVPGMRVRIHKNVDKDEQEESHKHIVECKDMECCLGCTPGQEEVNSYEDRVVVRIIHHRDGHSMTLRFDQPLTYDHREGSVVVPERLIRARRYCGHICKIGIDRLEPDISPDHQNLYGPYSLEGGSVLESGLFCRVSVEGKDTVPQLISGDAWSFAARAGGWVETRVFAPVTRIPRGLARLAKIVADDSGKHGKYRLIDIRPVPAPLAHSSWLEMIRTAAEEIAIATEHNLSVLVELTRYNRVQVGLVNALEALTTWLPDFSAGDERCDRAIAALSHAISVVPEPRDAVGAKGLAKIAVAMERLALAIALKECGGVTGPMGPKGPQGEMGPMGPKGDSGPKGDTGPTGPMGPKGPQGEMGPMGPKGPQGEMGSTGPMVSQGATGSTGPMVSQGATGSYGDTGSSEEPNLRKPQSTNESPDVSDPTPSSSTLAAPVPDVPSAGAILNEPTRESGESKVTPSQQTREISAKPLPTPLEPLDPLALPVRLLRQFRASGVQRDRWNTFADVPVPSSLSREKERKLAEVVAELLDKTARIGAKADGNPAELVALQSSLDALWKSRFHVEKLPRTLKVVDAVALYRKHQRTEREGS